MATFSNTFHGDNHGAIVQAGRDITIGDPREARAAIRAVQEVLMRLDAGPEAERHADLLEAELAAPRPDRATVASRLKRLTEMLAATGALVSAGAALAGPLGAIAGFAGAVAGCSS